MKLIVLPRFMSKGVLNSQVLTPWRDSPGALFFDRGHILDKARSKTVGNIFKVFSIRKNISKVYCRDIYSFLIFFLLTPFFPYSRIIYDFRGIVHEESYMRNGSELRRRFLKVLEKICYANADDVRAVSQNMADYLKSNFGERTVDVIPCCISKAEIVSSLSDRSESEIFRFIYVGSISKWQCFEDAVRMYSEVELPKSIEVYTPNTSEANKILRQFSIDCIAKEATRSEIMSSLRQSDFGFVLRENKFVNIVASPVKFLEYVSQGVVPICTPFVGDYSRDFSEVTYSLMNINDKLSSEKLETFRTMDIKKSLIEKSKLYTWENHRRYFE